MATEKSASWFLKRAKEVRENRKDSKLKEILYSHVDDILSGKVKESLILDVKKLKEKQKEKKG